MNKTEWNERMFDAMLKLACEESLERELENVSKASAMNPVTPSKAFEKRMNKLIRSHSRQIRYKKAVKAFGRVASVILIIMGIAFSIVLSAQAVRSQVFRTITEWGEGFIGFSFKKEDSLADDSDGLLRPTYVPDGFSETGVIEIENMIRIEYRNDEQQRIIFDRVNKDEGYAIQIDSEHSTEQHDSINGIPIVILESIDIQSGYSTSIIWEIDSEAFIVMGNCAFDELHKMAYSIIVQIARK